MNLQQTIGRISERHQVSAEAVATLAEAMRRGGNRMAQFSHPELGGYGQWLPGMTQIGDMFNRELRARVERLCADLSKALDDEKGETSPKVVLDTASGHPKPETAFPAMKPLEPMKLMKPMEPMKPMQPMEPMKPMHGFESGGKDRWWPENLGDSPNSAGGQNEMRYAYFADKHRLVVDEGGGNITVYDTGDHQVSGVQQHQSGGGKKLVFSSEEGEVDLGSLKKV